MRVACVHPRSQRLHQRSMTATQRTQFRLPPNARWIAKSLARQYRQSDVVDPRTRASRIIQYLAMSSSYAPPPPPSQLPAYPPAVARPASRKKIVWIVLAAVTGGLLLLGLFIGVIVLVVFGTIRSSEPYRHAVRVASHDSRALSTLGGPVKP